MYQVNLICAAGSVAIPAKTLADAVEMCVLHTMQYPVSLAEVFAEDELTLSMQGTAML